METLARGIGIYSLQILVLVTAATLASCVRVPPRARLIFWRLVVAACLLLPLAPPGILEIDAAPVTTQTAMTAAIGGAMTGDRSAAASRVPWAAVIGWLLVAGAILRGSWLVIGLVRLRTLTEQSELADLDDDLVSLKRTLAPNAEIRWHTHVRQPVTFGVRHPVVLLP